MMNYYEIMIMDMKHKVLANTFLLYVCAIISAYFHISIIETTRHN